MASPATADYGPAPLDIVGAGSDTVQNIMNFVADGRAGQGNGQPFPTTVNGYNTAGNKYKLISLDATGDANDRSVYANGGTSPLKLSVIYRAGHTPQQRANGSGAGIAALNADNTTGTNETINYVRMSRLPKPDEIATADSNAGGGLHVVKIATDDLVMASASASTNAVPLTADQLVHVYQCDPGFTDWHDLNPSAPAGSTIIPEVPQSGSGTGDTFRADMAAAKGSAFTVNTSCVKITEENDPAAITAPPGGGSAANAIQPMSDGRVALFDSNYFHDPAGAFPSSTALTSGVHLMYGSGGAHQTPNNCTKPTAPGQTLAYCNTRGLYVVWRHSDDTFASPWQPGSTRNWVQTLFWRPAGQGTPYIKTAAGQADVAAGGVSPVYVDCGTDPTSC